MLQMNDNLRVYILLLVVWSQILYPRDTVSARLSFREELVENFREFSSNLFQYQRCLRFLIFRSSLKRMTSLGMICSRVDKLVQL